MNLPYSVVKGKVLYGNVGAVETELLRKISTGYTLHLSLIDPGKEIKDLAGVIQKLDKFGTDVLLIGGSTDVTPEAITNVSKTTEDIGLPTIIFPSAINHVEGRANAMLFMRCTNSSMQEYLFKYGLEAAQQIYSEKLQSIPLTYLIIESGGTVGKVSRAKVLPRDKPEIAAKYAREAELNGSRWLYLEAGSGVRPGIGECGGPTLISCVRSSVRIPILAGGGVRTVKDVHALKNAGVNGIVTGNTIENLINQRQLESMKELIEAVHL